MRYCSIHRLDYVAQCDACAASRDRKKRDEDKMVDDDPIQLKKMLALRKRLDPDAPDMIAFREQYMGDFEQSHAADGDLTDRVLQILGNPGITETTYAKLKVVLAGKAYTAPLDDYVTLLERNNGRLREVLKEALEQTGCDGDLCSYRWHEKARALLGE